MPASAQALLDDGLTRLGLADSLPDGGRDALLAHARFLLTWTEAINLTAIREPEAVVREHLLDSLAAVPLLRERGVRAVVDIGSGGGFPGLPVALVLPAERALLVESIGKKARFLETVASAVGAGERIRVAATRAEELTSTKTGGPERGRWQAVTARAVADLSDLVELALPFLGPGGIFVAWKREPFDAELEGATQLIGRLGGGRPRVERVVLPGLEDHILVVIEKTGPTPPAYPRDPASRRRTRG